jgi:hypothetical protein
LVDAYHADWFNTTTGEHGGQKELMTLAGNLYLRDSREVITVITATVRADMAVCCQAP